MLNLRQMKKKIKKKRSKKKRTLLSYLTSCAFLVPCTLYLVPSLYLVPCTLYLVPYFIGGGASSNFLYLPESFPKNNVIGNITFFTKPGISSISNSDL